MSVMGSSSSQPVADLVHGPNMDDLAASQQLVVESTPGLLPSVFYENMAANATMQASPASSKKRFAVGVRIPRKSPTASPSKPPIAPPPHPPPPLPRPARRSVYEIPLSDDEDEGRGATGDWPISPAALPVRPARHRAERSNKIEVPDSQPAPVTVHTPIAPSEPAPVSADEQASASNIKKQTTSTKHSRSTLKKAKKKNGGRNTTMAVTETAVASSSQNQPKTKCKKSAVSLPAPVSGEIDTTAVTPSPALPHVPTERPTSPHPKRGRGKAKKRRKSTSDSAQKEQAAVVDEVVTNEVAADEVVAEKAVPEQSPKLERSLWTFRKTKPVAREPEPEYVIDGFQDDAHNDNGGDNPSQFDAEPALDATSDADMANVTITQTYYSVEDESMDFELDGDNKDMLKTPLPGRYNVAQESHIDDEPGEDAEESQNNDTDDDIVVAKPRSFLRKSRASGSKEDKDETYSTPPPDSDAFEWSDSSSGEDEIPPTAPPNYQGSTKKRRSNVSPSTSLSSKNSREKDEIPPSSPPNNRSSTRKRQPDVERTQSLSSEHSQDDDEIPPTAPPVHQKSIRKRQSNVPRKSPLVSKNDRDGDKIPASAPPSARGSPREPRSKVSRRTSLSSEQSQVEDEILSEQSQIEAEILSGSADNATAADHTTALERVLKKVREIQDPPDLRSTGSFTWDEEELIRRAIQAFQTKKGLETSALVEVIQSDSNDLLFERRELWRELKIHVSHREEASVKQHVKKHYHMCKTGRWTAGEDARLKSLAKSYPNQWKVIAQLINRTRFEINRRWREIHRKGFKRNQEKAERWTKLEQLDLVDAVTTVAQRDEDARAQAKKPSRAEYNRKQFDWSQVAREIGQERTARECFEKWAVLKKSDDPPKITISLKTREAVEGRSQSQDVETEEEPVQGQGHGQAQEESDQSLMSEEAFQNPISDKKTLKGTHVPRTSGGETHDGPVRSRIRDAQTQEEPVGPRMKDAAAPAKPVRFRMRDAQTQTEPVLPKMQDAQTLTEPVQPQTSENRGTLTKCQCQCQCQDQPPATQTSVALGRQAVKQQQSHRTVRESDDTPLESPRLEEDEPASIPQAEEESTSIPQDEEKPLLIQPKNEPAVPEQVSLYGPLSRRRRRTSEVTPPESPLHERDEKPEVAVAALLNSPKALGEVKRIVVTPPQSLQEEEEEPVEAAEAVLVTRPRSGKAQESEMTLPGPLEEEAEVEATAATETGRDKKKKRRKSKKTLVAPRQSTQAEGEEEARTAVAAPIVTSRPAVAQMLWGDKYDLAETLLLNEQESKDHINWADVAASLKRPWPVETLQAALQELFGLVEAQQLVDEGASLGDYMFAIMDFLSQEHGSQLEEHYQSDVQEEATKEEQVEVAKLVNSKKKKRKRTESDENGVQGSQGSVVKKQKRPSSRPGFLKGLFGFAKATMESDEAGSD